jgi:WD40 repeat protein
VAFSPDGKKLATGSGEYRMGWGPGAVTLWDPATGGKLADCPGRGATIHSLAFNGDGTRLVSTSYDRTATIWDTSNGREVRALGGPDGHQRWVLGVAFSPDGKKLATGGDDRQVKVWDAATGRLLSLPMSHGHWVYSLRFSADGTRLYSGSGDRSVKVWDLRTWQEVATLAGHGDQVYGLAVPPNDAHLLASGSADGTVRLWDLLRKAEVGTYQAGDQVYGLAFSPDGTTVAAPTRNGKVHLFRVDQVRRPGMGPLEG